MYIMYRNKMMATPVDTNRLLFPNLVYMHLELKVHKHDSTV